MTRNSGWMLAAALLLTGIVVGALGMEAWRIVRGDQFAHMKRVGPHAFLLDRLSADLNLSAEQRQKIEPLVREMMSRIDDERRPFMDKEEAILDDYMGRMDAFLTPEQVQKHEKRRAEFRERRKNMRLMPPGGPGGPGGPPPPDFFGGPPPPPPGALPPPQ